MHRSGRHSQGLSPHHRQRVTARVDAFAPAATIEPVSKSKDQDSFLALAALLPAWLALAWLISKAQWFWTHRPDMQFGWIVLLLCAFVIWDRWTKKPAPVFRPTWLFVLFALLGSGMLFLIQIYQ